MPPPTTEFTTVETNFTGNDTDFPNNPIITTPIPDPTEVNQGEGQAQGQGQEQGPKLNLNQLREGPQGRVVAALANLLAVLDETGLN